MQFWKKSLHFKSYVKNIFLRSKQSWVSREYIENKSEYLVCYRRIPLVDYRCLKEPNFYLFIVDINIKRSRFFFHFMNHFFQVFLGLFLVEAAASDNRNSTEKCLYFMFVLLFAKGLGLESKVRSTSHLWFGNWGACSLSVLIVFWQ